MPSSSSTSISRVVASTFGLPIDSSWPEAPVPRPICWRPSVLRCSAIDRVHPGPGQLQRGEPRLGQRSQPDPGDQPRRRDRIVDARRPVADAGPDIGEHVVAGNAEIVGARQQQPDDAGADQAGGAVGQRLQRQIFVALAGAGADLPDVRDRRARGDRLERRRDVDRRGEADGQRDPAIVLAAAQGLAHCRDRSPASGVGASRAIHRHLSSAWATKSRPAGSAAPSTKTGVVT